MDFSNFSPERVRNTNPVLDPYFAIFRGLDFDINQFGHTIDKSQDNKQTGWLGRTWEQGSLQVRLFNLQRRVSNVLKSMSSNPTNLTPAQVSEFLYYGHLLNQSLNFRVQQLTPTSSEDKVKVPYIDLAELEAVVQRSGIASTRNFEDYKLLLDEIGLQAVEVASKELSSGATYDQNRRELNKNEFLRLIKIREIFREAIRLSLHLTPAQKDVLIVNKIGRYELSLVMSNLGLYEGRKILNAGEVDDLKNSAMGYLKGYQDDLREEVLKATSQLRNDESKKAVALDKFEFEGSN